MSGPWPDLAGRIEGDAHVLPVRVYYEDTDFSGVVYHAGYLRFMERGRSDVLRLLGFEHGVLAEQGIAFAVRRMTIEFKAPARIDDVLDVRTRPVVLKGATLVLDQRVSVEDRLLIEAEVTVVLVDRDGRPRRFPAALLEAFAPYVGTSRLP